MKPKISIIIVIYKSGEIINSCLKNIYSSSLEPLEVTVINNGPKESVKYIYAYNYPNLKIIQNKKNIGFAKANNIGIKLARGKYILVLNPDVILMKDTLSKMFNFMEKFKEVNIAGCKLTNPLTEKVDDSARKFPNLWGLFLRRFGFNNGYDYNLTTIKQPIRVDWLSGAFMLMSKKYFFDEHYFLYFEDIDLCRKIGSIFYNPRAIAHHYAQRMSSKKFKYFLIHLKSMLYYFKKWKTLF